MKSDNPSWGAPRIHGELLQRGFDVSEPTLSRYLQRLRRRPDNAKAQRWLAFVQNHREVMAAFDFFIVPTLSFRVLYCFFLIEHGLRRILHSTRPHTRQASGQLREALQLPCPYRCVIFDRDRKFSTEVRTLLKASGIKHVRMSVRSPWQNRVAERWVGSIRREMLTTRRIYGIGSGSRLAPSKCAAIIATGSRETHSPYSKRTSRDGKLRHR